MGSSLQLIGKRTLAHWRLLSAVLIGVVLAVTIMSASVVYFEALRDVALQKSLADVPEAEIDILVEAGQVPTNRQTYDQITDAMEGTIVHRVTVE